MKALMALFGLLLVFAGVSFAADDTDYTHYCYRVCCLNLDATYIEGPPQQCIGPRATGNEVQNCVDQCLYELGAYYEDKPNPTYVTVDQVERGVVYDPETGSVTENPEAANEDIETDAVNTENINTPLAEEEPSSGSSGSGNVPLPPGGKTGGLCPLGFLLLVPLFLRK